MTLSGDPAVVVQDTLLLLGENFDCWRSPCGKRTFVPLGKPQQLL